MKSVIFFFCLHLIEHVLFVYMWMDVIHVGTSVYACALCSMHASLSEWKKNNTSLACT